MQVRGGSRGKKGHENKAIDDLRHGKALPLENVMNVLPIG